MIISKNTFGISYILDPRLSTPDMLNKMGGSSLERKETKKRDKVIDPIKELIDKPLGVAEKEKKVKMRTMSPRTRSKIRVKLISFSRLHKNLTFLTLTFVNLVEDQLAIKVLRAFLDNAKKRLPDFEYLWVAERQTQNETFKDNIHFHIITNKFWMLDKWWPYWLDLQAKFGIKPRDENFRPGSAFNVRKVETSNIKQLSNYLTKYVTKNSSMFACQVWNCSKKISRLYTSFYSGMNFINQLERLDKADQLGGKLKTYKNDYCNICIIPLNRITTNFYNKIDEKNKTVWKQESTAKPK